MNIWYDQPRNIIMYDTPTPLDIARVIPNAFQIYNGMVGVPATLQNLQRLRSINYPIVPPMERYDWPHHPTKTPWEVQKTTANFMVSHPRSFVLNGMRTGKTLSSLWAADFVMSHYPRGSFKAIIVSTLKTLRLVWGNSIFENFIGRRTFSIVHGTAEQRMKALEKEADFYIINHDGLTTGLKRRGTKYEPDGLLKALMARHDIRMVIVDECSAYKNHTTGRWHALDFACRNKEYLWMMTGTPTPQGPMDAYGQARMMGTTRESMTAVKLRLMYQVSQFKWLPRPGAAEEAKKLLSPSIRFVQTDVFDSPPLLTMPIEAPLSKQQREFYEKLKKELRLEMTKGRIDVAHEGALRMKLIQIACGAVYDTNKTTHNLDVAPRMEALKEVIEEADGKVIVFAPLTNVLHLLCSSLKDYGALLVNGEIGPSEADRRLHEFNTNPAARVLVAHPGPVARGLDLTAAATIVWYCATDRTEDYLQANERINGINQTRKRTIVQLSSTPVEREIFKRLENNESMQGVILQMARDEGR